MMQKLEWTYLETLDYELAMRIQYTHVTRVGLGKNPRLFLLQHPPTVTLGRQANASNLRLSKEQYQKRGIEVALTKRGGDVTYHGPGQLVGYPVASLDELKLSVPEWVKRNARAVMAYLETLGIHSVWSDQHPGVWVGERKIAALGFHISKRISTHGFALNLQPDLSHFDTIIPCGLQKLGTTSVADLGIKVPGMETAASEIASLMARELGLDLGAQLDSREVLGEPLDEDAIVSVA